MDEGVGRQKKNKCQKHEEEGDEEEEDDDNDEEEEKEEEEVAVMLSVTEVAECRMMDVKLNLGV
jgi:hypothetical protein